MKEVLKLKVKGTFKELKNNELSIKITDCYSDVWYAYIKTTKNDSQMHISVNIPSMGKGIYYTHNGIFNGSIGKKNGNEKTPLIITNFIKERFIITGDVNFYYHSGEILNLNDDFEIDFEIGMYFNKNV
jgi:hypothetical protein